MAKTTLSLSAGMSHSATTPATRALIPAARISPDPDNRRVIEDDDFEALCDSIRVLGVLQPLQVWCKPDGTHRLIDGERRWRAAKKVGLTEVPCDVWPSEADPRRVAVAGFALNEHRRAHGCLHVARRLRAIKNEGGLSHEEVAAQTGLPLDRVKTYFSLFGGSEDIHKFLEDHEVALKVAAEIVRYEKATNEARARRLLARHKDSPLTVQEIVTLRKQVARGRENADEKTSKHHQPGSRLVERLESQMRKDPTAITQLKDLAERLGFRLVPLARDSRDGGSR